MSAAKTYFSAFALVVGCAIIAFALWHIAELTGIEAALTMACLLLGASQILMHIGRDRRADRTIAQVDDLALASAQTVREVDSLKQSLREVEQAVESSDATRQDELATQVRVLETLVKQLAEKVAALHNASAEANSPRPSAPSGDGLVNGSADGKDADAKAADAKAADAQMLEKVRHSLDENRVDLYLQPIVMLPQRKTRYYEALTRLRDSSGRVIMPSSYLEVAESAGIMPMIDNLLLFRCVRVVRRLVERNREIGVFCNISAHSLLDSEFFPQFLEFMKQNEELSDSLIFEFSQSTINGAGPLEFESLAMLHELGFRFSLDRVTSMDIDFQAVADRGFRYLKVPAETLINGMSSSGAQIHSADLKALLQRFGLALIAEKIETERDVVTLLDFDVSLGQGYLFSEPRLVREEIVDSPRTEPVPAI